MMDYQQVRALLNRRSGKSGHITRLTAFLFLFYRLFQRRFYSLAQSSSASSVSLLQPIVDVDL